MNRFRGGRDGRCGCLLTLVVLIMAGLATEARGETRKFTIMGAVPIKSAPSTGGPNLDAIRSIYFDPIDNPNVDSWAEYWYEISYGQVTVQGDVFGWPEVPWPVVPAVSDGETIPFIDLNSSFLLEQFEGEPVDESEQMILIDYNGVRDGTGEPDNFWSTEVVTPEGFLDIDPNNFDPNQPYNPVWTPGERFRDLNDNGRYDALLEPARDGWGGGSNCCSAHDSLGCDDELCQETVCSDADYEYCCVSETDPNETTGACCSTLGDNACWVMTQGACEDGTLGRIFIELGTDCSDLNGNNVPDACEGVSVDAWNEACALRAAEVCGNPPGSLCEDCDQDGTIDDGEYVDRDGSDSWSFPEPFEDFLVIYNPNSTLPDGRWVKLDPSYKNTNEASRAWAENYIRRNYPGYAGEPLRKKGDTNASGFLARFGNDKYDGPDRWIESGSTSKMQQRPSPEMWEIGLITPRPEFSIQPWDYERWWEAYWHDRHVLSGYPEDTIPPAPEPPEWQYLVPRFIDFNPGDPSVGSTTTGDPRIFRPNCGGDKARMDPADPDWQDPNDPESGCIDPPPDPQSFGDGSVANNPGGNILPDVLDSNSDSINDYYDGPAEFDDLPSSLYHASIKSDLTPNESGLMRLGIGLGEEYGGGDGRLGEVTSPWHTTPYGGDIGAGHPDNPSGPDGRIPPGGPLAYNVHGANGYDAGNVLNLEFLTWSPAISSSATSTLTGLAFHSQSDETIWIADGASRIYADFWGVYGGVQLVHVNVTHYDWDPNMAPNPDIHPPGSEIKTKPTDSLIGVSDVSALVFVPDDPNACAYGDNACPGRLYGVRNDPDSFKKDLLLIDQDSGALETRHEILNGTPTKPLEVRTIVDLAYDQYDPNNLTSNPDYWYLYLLVDSPTGSELWYISPDSAGSLLAHYLNRVGDPNQGGISGLAAGRHPLPGKSHGALYTKDLSNNDLAWFDPYQPSILWPLFDIAGFDINGLGYAEARAGHVQDPNDPNDTTPSYPGYGERWYTANGDSLVMFDLDTNQAGTIGSLNLGYLLTQAMKRDYNLDGMIDQGEVRLAGTESYSMDTFNVTQNDGGLPSYYPFNRRRLTEDVVAALDESVDWEFLVMPVSNEIPADLENPDPNDNITYTFDFLHSAILIPEGICPPGIAAGGRDMFVLPAPSMDLPVQVRDNESSTQTSTLWYSDWAAPLDGAGDAGEPGAFLITTMAHEWLHVWEGYPDLYDYDTYFGGFEQFPVGYWDIMASGTLVHPSPPLKQSGEGIPWLGTDHEPWIDVTDLTTVLNPWEEKVVPLYDYAIDPATSVYVFQNTAYLTDPNQPEAEGEIFYFWRITDFINGGYINYNINAPGEGILIMHTDFGANPEAMPPQTGPAGGFRYNIVQADGLQQLENGENAGDSGDPFPGSEAITLWNESTDPSSRWWGDGRSGIEIRNINEKSFYSDVTFYWSPRWVPELTFRRPPGNIVLSKKWFQLGYKAFDLYGGTNIEFYADRDAQGYDGDYVGEVHKEASGVESGPTNVDISGLDDGEYYFYARLVPGLGVDNQLEPSSSVPRADVSNRGRGSVNITNVDTALSFLEKWTVTCIDHEYAGSEEWHVEGSLSGLQSQTAVTGQYYTTPNGALSFRITSNAIIESPQGADLIYDNGKYLLQDHGDPNIPKFIAVNFKEGDMVRITGGNGANPGFYTILSVPSKHTLKLNGNPGVTSDGSVTYYVHSFSDDSAGGVADRFHLMTTGKTPYSLPVEFLNGEVVPRVYAALTVSYDPNNVLRTAPLRVFFDASDSLDENGNLNPALEYQWDINDDGVVDYTGAVIEHVYDTPHPQGITATVTVTHDNPADPTTPYTDTIEVVVIVYAVDTDGDDVADPDDNCVDIPNPEVVSAGSPPACAPPVGELWQVDSDCDDVGDVCDNCPDHPNFDQADTDGDGTGDACDFDSDGDGIDDSIDACPNDPTKWDSPDVCGCGVSEIDSDGDGAADCIDDCPNNPNKTEFGVCGCSDDETDSDGDGKPDCIDLCPHDPAKTKPGLCGCGFSDGDSDNDGAPDCRDNCPQDQNTFQIDLDGDGIGDVCDNCPSVWNPFQVDDDQDNIGDACDSLVKQSDEGVPSLSNEPLPDTNGTGGSGTTDQDQSQTDDSDQGQSQADAPQVNTCGPGACGGGLLGWLPLTMLGLCCLKLPRRRTV